MKDMDQLMKDIIVNLEVQNLWIQILNGEPVGKHPFAKIVEYQKEAYENNENKKGQPRPLDPWKEGFQVGEPWNGDLQKASILFLSSNPAITVNEKFPRWHPERSASDTQFTFYGLNGDGTPRYGDFVGIEEVKKFYIKRFEKTPFNVNPKNKRNPMPTVEIIEEQKSGEWEIRKKPKGVLFWWRLCKAIENFLPDEKGEPGEGQIRCFLSHAVSSEIVPFKSMKEHGVSEVLETCWKDYSSHILRCSTAPVVVLVGSLVRKQFLEAIFHDDPEKQKNVREILDGGQIFQYDGRAVVAMPHFSNRGKDELYLPKHCLPKVFDKLKALIEADLSEK